MIAVLKSHFQVTNYLKINTTEIQTKSAELSKLKIFEKAHFSFHYCLFVQ